MADPLTHGRTPRFLSSRETDKTLIHVFLHHNCSSVPTIFAILFNNTTVKALVMLKRVTWLQLMLLKMQYGMKATLV
uniref:Uncharacterized protein n=1 Tax=Knipowitschia caucasica TaxID=637954 RepID=A0AAV2MQ04_KNICA